jgi:hypothetical protein
VKPKWWNIFGTRKCIKREDGKIQKPADFSKPDLRPYLNPYLTPQQFELELVEKETV